jgi:molecular chaperone HscB
LFSPDPSPTPFEVLGLAPAFALDAKELKQRLLRASRVVHPDYFGAAAPEVRALAERNSALVNEAYATLLDPAARADWLVRALGGPSESEQRDMPRSFLLDVLEWNETLEAAREAAPGTKGRAALVELASTLASRRESVLRKVGELLAPLPELGSTRLRDARAELNALRYLENTLAQIEALRVAQATAH